MFETEGWKGFTWGQRAIKGSQTQIMNEEGRGNQNQRVVKNPLTWIIHEINLNQKEIKNSLI